MSLSWIPREGGVKDHIYGDGAFRHHGAVHDYEEKPILDPAVNRWRVAQRLDYAENPAQYNSYTTEWLKGVIAVSSGSGSSQCRSRGFYRGRKQCILHRRQYERIF